jgi:hypothetical protein
LHWGQSVRVDDVTAIGCPFWDMAVRAETEGTGSALGEAAL